MTTNLIHLLARLHEAALEVCRTNLSPTPVQYFIGDYGFWINPEGELIACPVGMLDKNIGGRFALAWLSDAIMAECERRGWGWEVTKTYTLYHASVWPDASIGTVFYSPRVGVNKPTESLLIAFLAAVEAERVR